MPLPWAEVWKSFLPILDALVALHSKGLIHGNLSLATFKFNDAGGLDDGCIERLEAQAAVQSLLNIGPYTAPELALGTGADDPRVDVYSLGIILYELLCGRLPWSVDLDPGTLQDRKTNSKLPNPKRFQPDIPLDVLKVLRAATSGSPQVRPQSGVVMRALLGPAVHSVADEGELSSLTLDADSGLLDQSQPQDEPDTDLSQLANDFTPAGKRPGYDRKIGEAATTVISAADRPGASASPPIMGTDPVSQEDRPVPPDDIGDAATTVLTGVERPETPAASMEATDVGDAGRPSQSNLDLATGAVTTIHPAAIREGAESDRPPAPENPRAQVDDIRALLATSEATESTEVLNYTESDRLAPISRPSGERDFILEEAGGSPKPKRRRKGAARKKKKAKGLPGGLLLGLTLSLGVVAVGGLLLGLMFIRSLAQGPDSGQVEALLGLTDEGQRSDGPRGGRAAAADPYSERWRAQEGPEQTSATDEAEDGDGGASEDEAPPGAQGSDRNASDPTATNEPEPGGGGSLPVTRPGSEPNTPPEPRTKSASGKGRSATLEPPRGSTGAKSSASAPSAAPETVLKISQLPRVTSAQIGRRTLFSVEIPRPPSGPGLSVKLRMRCVSDGGRWRLYKMKRSGRNTWDERINFDVGDRGPCDYYFTARTDGDASSSSLGSKSEPLRVQVR
jgi:hypothetical protein